MPPVFSKFLVATVEGEMVAVACTTVIVVVQLPISEITASREVPDVFSCTVTVNRERSEAVSNEIQDASQDTVQVTLEDIFTL